MIRKNLSTIILIAVICILYLTGGLQHISGLAQSAVVHSGFVDADVAAPKDEAFDFNFTVKDLQGNRTSFEQYKGKVIFLNLWATWCGPCKAEMPSIQKLYDQVDHNQFAFVLLSIDRDKDFEKVKKYVQNQSYTFPVFTPSGFLTEQLNVPSIPTTFVISKEGKLVMKEVGMKNYNTSKFKKYLEALAK